MNNTKQYLENNIHSSKEFFSALRNISKSQAPQNNIAINEWYEYFQGVFNVEPEVEYEEQSFQADCDPADSMNCKILDSPITQEEIRKAINDLKVHKSPGLDSVIPEFFKCSSEVLLPYLELLFNSLFDRSYFPEDWAIGVIVPLHKKGSRNDVNNYRGITLLSVFSKIFVSIIHTRLLFSSDTLDNIREEQAGFRSGYSTIDNIFILQSIIDRYIQRKGGKLYAIFIDFAKAFDSVHRDKMWTLFKMNKLCNKMGKFLCSIYKNVKSYYVSILLLKVINLILNSCMY